MFVKQTKRVGENEVLPNSAFFTCDCFINMYNSHKVYLLTELSMGILNHFNSHPGNFILNTMPSNLVIGSTIN